MLKYFSLLTIVAGFIIINAQTKPKTNSNTSKPKTTSTPTQTPVKKKSSSSAKSKPAPVSVKFKITGELEGYKNHLIVMSQFRYNAMTFMDSTRTDENGKFTFNNNLKNDGIVYIQYSSTTAVPLIVENGSDINIKIYTNLTGLNYDVTGIKSEKSFQLYNTLKTYSRKTNELAMLEKQIASESNSMISFNMQMDYSQKQGELLALLDSSINHKSPLEGYFVLFNLMQEQKTEDLKSIISKMEPKEVNSEYYQDVNKLYSENKTIEIGELAPDIELPQPDGSTLKLSSLRGKYVLIDFWASWCGPCIAEFPNVKKVYGLYKDKGFEIFGVSLDRDKTSWTNAIARLGLTWKHVSDLKYWSAAPAKLYKVHSIPFTVLIDKDGKVIAKNLRGAELEAKLKELFP
jgi:peroxiredoxin